ncbi:MAG: hypothetical protein WC451_00710 [Patescibacteria group bacterium]
MKSKLSSFLTGLGVVALVIVIVGSMGYAVLFAPDYHDDPEYQANQPDPLQADTETQTYREQLSRQDEMDRWASENHVETEIWGKTQSPDKRWTAWNVSITNFEGYAQVGIPRTEIHIKSSDGTEHQLDEANEAGRLPWLSEPVFSADSKRVAVFERDELGTGRILIWTLETGELKVVSPNRGDLERIYSDKEGVFHIGPEKHDYSTD